MLAQFYKNKKFVRKTTTTKLAHARAPWGVPIRKMAFWLVATNIKLGRPGVCHVAMTTRLQHIGGRLLVFSVGA
jgi:hypothetical protein